MKQVRFRTWIINADPETTTTLHSQIELGGAEECGCDPCLNFAASRESVYPAEFIRLLNELGIDPALEVEVILSN